MGIKVTGGVSVPQGKFSVTSNRAPTWITAAGTIGTEDEGTVVNFQFEATDQEQGTIGLTFSKISGDFPAGLSMNSAGLLTGTASDVGSNTTSNFTLRVADTPGLTADRAFSMTIDNVLPIGPQAWIWGSGTQGRTGLGNTTAYSSPVQIGESADWAVLSAGFDHTHGVKTDGTLWSWGKNSNFGQLGLGDKTNRNSPSQVGSLTDWVGVDAANSGAFAIKSDGTLWAWGRNNYGILGLGNIIDYSSPVQVGSLANWASCSAGGVESASNHVVALKTNGEMWSWGFNLNGRVGDGTVINRSSPVQIGALTTWSVISGGGDESFAIKADGTLWSWGRNRDGVLGLGTNYPGGVKSSPSQVGSLSDWTHISANKTAVGIRAGKLFTWGFGNSGSLGNGIGSGNISSPVQVGGLATWASASSAPSHSHALKTDGTLWSWGSGASGKLGLGDQINRSSPVQVGSDNNWTTISAAVLGPVAIKTTT